MGICGSKEETTDAEDRKTSRLQSQSKSGGLAGKPVPVKQNSNSTSSNTETTRLDKPNGGSLLSPIQNANESEKISSNDKELKVLLLGAGESGKSTIIQQLKILHQNGFSQEELLEYRPVVYRNILDIGKEIIEARSKFNIPLESDSGITEADFARFHAFDHIEEQRAENENGKGNESAAVAATSDGDVDVDADVDAAAAAVVAATEGTNNNQYKAALSSLTQFPPDLADTLYKLWKLPSTKELINGEHRSEFYLMDSAKYFVDDLDRISMPNYIPNEHDIIRSRQKTSGIFDSIFDVGSNLKLHMYDVGGQRSERKKWIHCFDNVTLIIFCVSLSEYDQLLLEDQGQNRFEESLVLFDNVVNSRWFARTSVVLFLNKIDLFAAKLQKVPLENYFPDYTGGQDINKAAKYILWRFVQLNRANLNIYPHVTQATDTSNIKLVFAAIKETILENTLKDSGVL